MRSVRRGATSLGGGLSGSNAPVEGGHAHADAGGSGPQTRQGSGVRHGSGVRQGSGVRPRNNGRDA